MNERPFAKGGGKGRKEVLHIQTRGHKKTVEKEGRKSGISG